MRRLPTVAAAVTAAVLACLPAVSGGTASASSAAEARRRAADAAAEVDALAARLEQQVAAEEEALRAVASGAQASIAALQQAEDAAADLTAARAHQARTVRALYSSGGELAVYASVLGSASLDDLMARQAMARHVLRSAADASSEAATSLAAAHRSAEAADAGARQEVATAADVADASRAVEETLVTARERLSSLDDEAARSTAAEEARRRWEEAERAAAARRSAAASGAAHAVSTAGIPAAFEALYQQAAQTCPGLRWTLLAAVGQVESRHGVHNGPSSAGAVGPMQFMPRTFAAYGVDGDGDGVADPWSPADAIFSAARYLCANGAGGGTPESDRRALLRYNDAQWYVDLVLGVEAEIVAMLATRD